MRKTIQTPPANKPVSEEKILALKVDDDHKTQALNRTLAERTRAAIFRMNLPPRIDINWRPYSSFWDIIKCVLGYHFWCLIEEDYTEPFGNHYKRTKRYWECFCCHATLEGTVYTDRKPSWDRYGKSYKDDAFSIKMWRFLRCYIGWHEWVRKIVNGKRDTTCQNCLRKWENDDI